MTIVFFLVSLFVICFLLTSKIFEIKVRRIHFLADAFIEGDKQLHVFIERAFVKYHLYRKIANIFVFEFLPSYIYEILHRLKDLVAKKYYETGDKFRGRRVLRSNGSVSSFLERLSHEKSNIRGHKI
jgi:hypothetical protein